MSFTITSAGGPTEVGGPVSEDTTWTKLNSPYFIIADVVVENGVALTIEPGVVVKFEMGKALQIDGELIAQGTGAQRIVFTSNQPFPAPGDWHHILFTNTSIDASYNEEGNYLIGSIMQYCTIEYAGHDNNPALNIESSSPLISDCTISDNADRGVYVDHGSPNITNCMISHNSTSAYGGGIFTYHGTVTISGNAISDNSAYCGGGIYTNCSTVTISDNVITGNSAYCGGGISFDASDGSTVLIKDNIIASNSASYGGGIDTSYGIVTISGNTIQSNSASENAGGIYQIGGTVTMIHNTIVGNSITGGDGKAGGIYVSTQPTINYNNLYSNTPYDVLNVNTFGSPDVDATNNWWGTADNAEILEKIGDWHDDSSLGIVNYSPHLNEPDTEAPPPLLVAETAIGEEQNGAGVVVIPTTIVRVKDPATQETISGVQIADYVANLTFTPGFMEILDIRGGDPPFDTIDPANIVIDNAAGTASVSDDVSPDGVLPSIIIFRIVARLIGSCLVSDNLSVNVTQVSTPDGATMNAQDQSMVLTFQRGNIDSNGVIDIVDGMKGAQYVVGIRPVDDIDQLNMASVHHDDGGDVKDITDCMFIAQYVVGIRNEYFELVS